MARSVATPTESPPGRGDSVRHRQLRTARGGPEGNGTHRSRIGTGKHRSFMRSVSSPAYPIRGIEFAVLAGVRSSDLVRGPRPKDRSTRGRSMVYPMLCFEATHTARISLTVPNHARPYPIVPDTPVDKRHDTIRTLPTGPVDGAPTIADGWHISFRRSNG
jgi:hypothetical protein